MKIGCVRIYCLGLFALGFLSACDQPSQAIQTDTGASILPRALAQTRTLDRDAYRILVSLDGGNQPYSLSRSNGQFALKLSTHIDDGSYELIVDVDIPINGEYHDLYSYSGTLVVNGTATGALASSALEWPDDDSDGYSNFIELDQSSVDLDNDNATNDRDTDADGDGALDISDTIPFGTFEVPQMVSIESGCFQMGSDSTDTISDSDEMPKHQVCLSAFNMGKFESTFAQYDTYTDSQSLDRVDDEGWGRGNRPIINVSWNNIQDYITWLNASAGENYRLPSESEWEYAARAGSTTLYTWGDDIGQGLANCDGCGSQWDNVRTASVGSFAANARGLQDVHGNVWEWVEDRYYYDYEGAPTDGSAWTSGDDSQRVFRGGAWGHSPRDMRSANRLWDSSDFRYFNLGFRLARDR